MKNKEIKTSFLGLNLREKIENPICIWCEKVSLVDARTFALWSFCALAFCVDLWRYLEWITKCILPYKETPTHKKLMKVINITLKWYKVNSKWFNCSANAYYNYSNRILIRPHSRTLSQKLILHWRRAAKNQFDFCTIRSNLSQFIRSRK